MKQIEIYIAFRFATMVGIILFLSSCTNNSIMSSLSGQHEQTFNQKVTANHVLLENQVPKYRNELAELKRDGFLDRRSQRQMLSALEDGLSIMTYLKKAIQSEQWKKHEALSIAQDLNHQGDVLDAGLNHWRDKLSVKDENRQVADCRKRLLKTSQVLHDTGIMIVGEFE